MSTLDAPVCNLIHEKLFTLLSAASIVSITDLNGIIIYANENFAAISGYTVKELAGKGHNIVNSGYHPKSVWADMWKTVRSGNIWRAEVKNRTRAGGYYWVDSQVMPVRDDTGKIVAYLSIGNDITQRSNLELAAETENKLLVLGPLVAFRWKATTGCPVEFASANAASVFGYSAQEFTTGSMLYTSVIHPDDVDRVIREAAAYAASGIDTFNQEYRIITKTGESRWVYDHAIAERGKDGGVICYHGHIYDITERKLAREEIMLINTRLTSLIESIPDAIFLKDFEGRWLITNEPAKKLFKLNEIDWVGKTDLQLSELHPHFWAAHETCRVNDEKAWQARKLVVFIECVADDQGRAREYEVRKMPIFNEDGSRRALVVIGADVTEKKLIEKRLESRNKRLEEIAWIFSHEVRGPVATVLGLINLFNHADKFDPLNEEVLTKILIPVNRLDEIIAKIVRKTHEVEAQFPDTFVESESFRAGLVNPNR